MSENDDCLPAARYLVRVAKVRDGTTRNGDRMLTLTLAVDEGDQEGQLLWDRLVMSERAARRAEHMAKALGIALPGEPRIELDALVGRRCFVTTETETFEGRARAVVKFWGYEPLADEEGPVGMQAEETPF